MSRERRCDNRGILWQRIAFPIPVRWWMIVSYLQLLILTLSLQVGNFQWAEMLQLWAADQKQIHAGLPSVDSVSCDCLKKRLIDGLKDRWLDLDWGRICRGTAVNDKTWSCMSRANKNFKNRWSDAGHMHLRFTEYTHDFEFESTLTSSLPQQLISWIIESFTFVLNLSITQS